MKKSEFAKSLKEFRTLNDNLKILSEQVDAMRKELIEYVKDNSKKDGDKYEIIIKGSSDIIATVSEIKNLKELPGAVDFAKENSIQIVEEKINKAEMNDQFKLGIISQDQIDLMFINQPYNKLTIKTV